MAFEAKECITNIAVLLCKTLFENTIGFWEVSYAYYKVDGLPEDTQLSRVVH